MKKKAIFSLLALLLITFLTSCNYKPGAGEVPKETAAILKQVQLGTQGLDFKFLTDYPPTNIYDTTDFLAIAEVWNLGASDLKPGDCFLELTGYDKNIMKGIYSRRNCLSSGTLEGKKAYNLKGSFNQVEYKSSSISLPTGVNLYEPTLNLMACYTYKTKANPLVCVENSLYQVASQQKSCLVKDVSLSGGQGAPVGVSYVDVEIAGNKAIFDITVKNYGSGRVISPLTSLSNCPNTLSYSDFDKIYYSVTLSGGTLISCKPKDGYVRLTNNEGKIICSFNIGNTPAYETPLMIDLDYNYFQSLKKAVKIVKTPGYD